MARRVAVADVRAALASVAPRADASVPKSRKAAVAAVFRDTNAGSELLLIRRAEHPRDPWSGHMGFPGGRVNEDDRDPLAAAIRETREELSLDLEASGELIGALSEVRTHLAPSAVPRAVVPFAFDLRDGDVELRTNHEVSEVVWVPLAFLLDRGNRSAMTWVRRGVPLPLPCYRVDGRVIWGLTLRVIDELLDALGDE
jgi:8-oxo-dGTP pyrophosphatase MutT (NUDIX family)